MTIERRVYNLNTKKGDTRSIGILTKSVSIHGYDFSIIAQEWREAQDAAEFAVSHLEAWLEGLTAEQAMELQSHLRLAGEDEYFQTKSLVMAAERAGIEARAAAMKDWDEKPDTGYDCYVDWA